MIRNFKATILLLIPFFTLLQSSLDVAAKAGDSTFVQALTFGSTRDTIVAFPAAGTPYSKVLMYYTLKCNPNQSPACGEWDYLTYTYIYDNTGVMDSNLLSHHNFEVDGAPRDTFDFSLTPGWRYEVNSEVSIYRIDTLALDSSFVGSGANATMNCLETSSADAHSFYIYRKDELRAAGVDTGGISGLRLYIQAAGNDVNHLQLRLGQTNKDSIDVVDTAGMQLVYDRYTMLNNGWQSFQFNSDFPYDTSKNLVVSISFDNQIAGTVTMITGDSVSYRCGAYNSDFDGALDFEGKDFVDIPAGALATADSQITIAFWVYGDAVIQPQNDHIFEAVNAAGQRVINIHHPWSNGQVYWDCGNDGGSYDRVNDQAAAGDYKGKWNHWAFTKDVSNGIMRTYLNGQNFSTGTQMFRDMSGITQVKLGSRGDGNSNYDGMISEFAIWDTVLSSTLIKKWINRSLDGSHPADSRLQLYYPMDETSGSVVNDQSGNGHHGNSFGMPEHLSVRGSELLLNWNYHNWRPNITIEQGKFNSLMDTIYRVDSFPQSASSLVLFADTNEPTKATDTILVYKEYSSIRAINGGNDLDTVDHAGDTAIYRMDTEYYGPAFEVVDRYELGRFITPYGNGLTLQDGFTWIHDVTDFLPVMNDSMRLTAGNWQEYLDLKFLFIEGIAPRTPLKMENMWNGTYNLNTIDQTIVTKTVDIDPDAKMFRLKTAASGHAFSNPTNCAEFCKKTHSVIVDNITVASFQNWTECALNPLFPQGGTWLIDRAGWCPGSFTDTYNHELTDFITPGTQADIDYDSQTDPYGNYRFASQLVSYSGPNFQLDAAIDEILQPNDWEYYSHFNPICDNAIVTLKNTGGDPIYSAIIEYWVDGGIKQYYNWSGNLKFLEEEEVTLPAYDFYTNDTSDYHFRAKLFCVNGYKDENPANDAAATAYELVPQYDTTFVLHVVANNNGAESGYSIEDINGTTLYSKNGYNNNSNTRETISLTPGCYKFTFKDNGHDGLNWWFNRASVGTGLVSFETTGGSVITYFLSPWSISPTNYIGDFGAEIVQYFTVGHKMGTDYWSNPGTTPTSCPQFVAIEDEENNASQGVIQIRPNPMSDQAIITTDLIGSYDFELYNAIGELVRTIANISDRRFVFERLGLSDGLYLYGLKQNGISVGSGKIVLER